MRVAVIGAGGVGGFVGGLLAKAGHEVTFLARGAHLAAIRERGLTLKSVQAGDFTIAAAATDRPAELGRNDLVVVAVKMYDFAGIVAAAAAALAPEGVVLPLQNGLEAPDLLAAAAGRERTLVGTISVEAAIAAPGTVAHTTPNHQLSLAALSGPPGPRLEALAAAFREAGVNVRVGQGGRQILWEKASVLIPFATLTSAGDCTLGDIWAVPALKQAWDRLAAEAIAAAAADGYDVRREAAAMAATFEKMLPRAAGFTSSMNRDFRAGRPTELEWLTGAVVRVGRDKGAPAPAHEALYGVLNLRERRRS
ncbi:MAG TPA: 2-dehydropantoate 2-reductase [Hyphomicrobiales bacterium]|nr:2-dehydropantoate 2-reductase [Hyphomicrobiales bacterium]